MPDSFSEMRRRNAIRVLELIREHGELSRADLARLTDLSKATISSIASDLLGSGLVRETGSLDTEKGRKPVGLVFNPGAKLACGISIDDQHRLTVVVINMDGSIALQSTSSDSIERVDADSILQMLQRKLADAGMDIQALCAMGLAVPSPIERASHDFHFALAESLSAKRGHRVLVESLVDMAALAESSVDSLPSDRLVMFIRTSYHLRGTLLFKRKLMAMHGDLGGDLGYICAPWISDECSCGNTACVNAHAGTELIVARARSLGADVQNVNEIAHAAAAGNQTCLKVLADAGKATGYAIACMMNVLAPVSVIVSGPIAETGDVFWNAAYDACKQYCTEKNFAASEMRRSCLGTEAPALGAALHALAAAPIIEV